MTVSTVSVFFPMLFIFMVTISYAASRLIWSGLMALIPVKRSKDNGRT